MTYSRCYKQHTRRSDLWSVGEAHDHAMDLTRLKRTLRMYVKSCDVHSEGPMKTHYSKTERLMV